MLASENRGPSGVARPPASPRAPAAGDWAVGMGVRRVARYIEDHLADELQAARIARACGLSVRTLHRWLQREMGATPMVLVRRARLLKARAALECPSPGTTVTAAAMACGLTHLGRFSKIYAQQFGESPSATLRRARRRSEVPAAALPPGPLSRDAVTWQRCRVS